MLIKLPLSLAVAASLAVLAGGCGGSTRAIRIAVISDCEGITSAGYEFALAGAELPLLERGAKLRGRKPSEGITGASVAGRSVELLFGCARGFSRTSELAELRRLVERDGADVVIGGDVAGDGLAARDYAKRHRGVTFIVNETDQSFTLQDPAPNLFRFRPSVAQWGAGLGTYAYRTLGWRSAVTVAEDDHFGWTSVAGFIAEFCSLGGNVVQRLWGPGGGNFTSLAARVSRKADGVFLPDGIFDSRGFVSALAARRGNLAHSLVIGDVVVAENAGDRRLLGVVASNTTPWAISRAWRAYLAELAHRFPSIKVEKFTALDWLDAMEPVLEALQQVHGDLSHGERRLQAALARLRFDSPEGRRWVDSRHQEVGPIYLGRVEEGGQVTRLGVVSHVRQIRAVPKVEQTFGGYFSGTTPAPSRTQPTCRHGHPPPWAR
jgi:branched-chain amino acid transport system substrate-binding protein